MEPSSARLIAFALAALLGLLFASGFVLAMKAAKAFRRRELLFTPKHDHPALQIGAERLAVRQAVFMIVLGQMMCGIAAFGIGVLIRSDLFGTWAGAR